MEKDTKYFIGLVVILIVAMFISNISVTGEAWYSLTRSGGSSKPIPSGSGVCSVGWVDKPYCSGNNVMQNYILYNAYVKKTWPLSGYKCVPIKIAKIKKVCPSGTECKEGNCVTIPVTTPTSYFPVTIQYQYYADLSGVEVPANFIYKLKTDEKIIALYATDNEGFSFIDNPSIKTSKIWLVRKSNDILVFYHDINHIPALRYIDKIGIDETKDLIKVKNGDIIQFKSKSSVVSIEYHSNFIPGTLYTYFGIKNEEIASLGDTWHLAESQEIGLNEVPNPTKYLGTYISDYTTKSGIIIKNPKLNGNNDKVILEIPLSAPITSCVKDSDCSSGYVCSNGACISDGGTGLVTYKDGDPYIGYDPYNPLWIWDLENLNQVTATTIISKDDGTLQKSGPIIGIQNDDVRDDDTDNPFGVGECYVYPNDYTSVCLDSLTVNANDYLTTTIEYATSEDLSNVYPVDKSLGTSESVIKISAPGDSRFKLNNDVTTSKIFIADINGVFKVYYYNPNLNPTKRYLGEFTTSTYTLGTLNYGNTQNLQILLDHNTNPEILLVTLKSPTTGIQPIIEEKISMEFGIINNRINSLGLIRSSEEARELYWLSPSLSIGTLYRGNANNDLRTRYGIIIKNPKANSASDKVVLQIPKERVEANVVIKGIATTVLGGTGGGSGTGTLSVSGGITEDIPLGKAIAETTTWGLDWELYDSDISSLQKTTINFGGNMINIHDALILSKKSPSIETSLTSVDDDYGSNVFLEKTRKATNYYYYFDDNVDLSKVSQSNPLTIKFLGNTLKIIGITSNSITVQQ